MTAEKKPVETTYLISGPLNSSIVWRMKGLTTSYATEAALDTPSNTVCNLRVQSTNKIRKLIVTERIRLF
jgi:hypothetical protein